MTIRRGEIYLVNFGKSRGHAQEGIRPALVIQNDSGNETAGTTIIAAMSGRRGAAYPVHVDVSPRESGLREPSTILLEQLQTIDLGLVGRKVGELSPHAMEEVDRALHHSLGLTSCPLAWT